MSTLTKLIDQAVAPIETDLEGWEVIDGAPSMKTWIEYRSPDGCMISGCWEATPGTYRATYSTWEFIHLIEGEVVITPDGGEAQTFGPGDAAVLEAGFSGTWEIKKTVYKHFAIKLG